MFLAVLGRLSGRASGSWVALSRWAGDSPRAVGLRLV